MSEADEYLCEQVSIGNFPINADFKARIERYGDLRAEEAYTKGVNDGLKNSPIEFATSEDFERIESKLKRVQAVVDESKNDDAEIFFLKSNCTQVSLSAGRAICGCMSEYLSSYMMRIEEALSDD